MYRNHGEKLQFNHIRELKVQREGIVTIAAPGERSGGPSPSDHANKKINVKNCIVEQRNLSLPREIEPHHVSCFVYLSFELQVHQEACSVCQVLI